jgi:exodeoxyribonuclease VII small subunit
MLATLHAMTKSKQDSQSSGSPEEELEFEAALAELESLVEQMEGGDLSLDESLKAFERGVALTRHCSTALKQAELKVQALSEEGDLVDFDTEDFDDT